MAEPAELAVSARRLRAPVVLIDSLYLAKAASAAELGGQLADLRADGRTLLLMAHALPPERPLPGAGLWSGAVCPSRFAAGEARRAGLRGVAVCAPGIDACFINAGRRRAQSAAGAVMSSRERLEVVTVANLTPNKGHLHLADALTVLPAGSFTWHLAGTPIDEAGRRIAAELKRHPVAPAIVWHGGVSSEEVAAVLERADLCACASRSESYGMALAEAAAVGVPILASPVGGTGEAVAAAAAAELVPVDDLEAWRTALLRAHARRATPPVRPAQATPPRTWSVVAGELRVAALGITEQRGEA